MGTRRYGHGHELEELQLLLEDSQQMAGQGGTGTTGGGQTVELELEQSHGQ